jgi:hypothetical protein
MADIAAFVPAQNYTIQGANPSMAIAQGLQAGYGIQGEQAQLQAQQQALAQQAQLQQDLTTFASKPNPTASDYASIMARHPQLADRFKASYDVMDSAQKQEQMQRITPVYAALRTGNPSIATDVLDKQITAYENAGNQQGVQGAQMMKKWIETSPDSAMHIIGFQLAATQPDKFGDIVSNLSTSARSDALLPGEVQKGKGEAVSATARGAVDMAGAPALAQKPAIDNSKTLQDIEKSKADARIADYNAQINAANSDTERERLTLERDKFVAEQQQKQQAQGQAVQDSMDSANQALDTIKLIKNHPGISGYWTGSGTLWGKVWGKMPGSERNAANNWIESLKGQLAYDNLKAAKAASPNGASGFGNLTEGEMKMLSGLAGQLDPESKDFPIVLGKVDAFIQKKLAKAVANPSLPTTGGAFVANSPKYGTIDEGRINAVLRAHPELTRADVLRYLQQQGQ